RSSSWAPTEARCFPRWFASTTAAAARLIEATLRRRALRPLQLDERATARHPRARHLFAAPRDGVGHVARRVLRGRMLHDPADGREDAAHHGRRHDERRTQAVA